MNEAANTDLVWRALADPTRRAVLDLLAHPKLPSMRKAAREYAIARFHPERITQAYLEVYQKALES